MRLPFYKQGLRTVASFVSDRILGGYSASIIFLLQILELCFPFRITVPTIANSIRYICTMGFYCTWGLYPECSFMYSGGRSQREYIKLHDGYNPLVQ